MKRTATVVALIALVCVCARADQLDALQSAAADGYHRIDARELQRPFHVFVRLPRGYDPAEERRYPVIYLLDGGTSYPLLAPYFLLLGIDEPVPELIMVGVSYGAATPEEGNYRRVDYTAPSPTREEFGGAERFQAFLAEELMPMIEATYPADPARRILFGQSLGGQFVIFSAVTRPDLFWGHIASNAALNSNLDYFLALEPAVATGESHLVLASGSQDDERYRLARERWLDEWITGHELPWRFGALNLAGEAHASALPLAFRAGLRWLYPTDP